MSLLLTNTKNELIKIWMRRKNQSFLWLSFLITLAGALSFKFLQDKLGVFAVNSSSFPLFILNIMVILPLPLFILSASADLFAGELAEKTIKITLTKPISRYKIFVSKNIALIAFSCAILGITLITSLLSGLFLSISTTWSGLAQNLLAYAVTLFPIVFFISFASFVGQFFKNSGTSLASGVFLYAVLRLVPFLSSTIGRISPFSYLDWYQMWIGNVLSPTRLVTVFTLLIAYSLLLFTGGYYQFDRKEI